MELEQDKEQVRTGIGQGAGETLKDVGFHSGLLRSFACKAFVVVSICPRLYI